jgi:hypothetical protein
MLLLAESCGWDRWSRVQWADHLPGKTMIIAQTPYDGVRRVRS